MTKMLPCPFCGGEPKCNGHPGGIMGQIYCSNDDCFGPRTTALTKQDSIVQWNTRAAPARGDADNAVPSQIELALEREEKYLHDLIDDEAIGSVMHGDIEGAFLRLNTALVPAPSDAGREDEPEIDLLAKRLAGAELNYRNAYERNNDHINTGRMWDKMRRAGDAIRQYFHEREESPDPGTVAVASTEHQTP